MKNYCRLFEHLFLYIESCKGVKIGEIRRYLEQGLRKQRFVNWCSAHRLRCMSGLSEERSARQQKNVGEIY